VKEIPTAVKETPLFIAGCKIFFELKVQQLFNIAVSSFTVIHRVL